jgi:rubrerythrin
MKLADGYAHEVTSTGSRRLFLRDGAAALSAGAVALLAGADALAASMPINPARDTAILNGAMSHEYLAIAAYEAGLRSGLLGRDLGGVASRFQAHHKTHCVTLAEIIRKIGGEPAAMKSQSDYEAHLRADTLASQDDILSLAVRLELAAISAYMGVIPALDHTDLAKVVARIAADEAAHYSALAGALAGARRAG